jgi:hypothetical protein
LSIYDKPTWQLIQNAAVELPEVFTSEEMLNWFRAKYPAIKESTIRAHLIGMSVNSRTRQYYKGLREHGVLYKVDRTRYTTYQGERHGEFDDYGRQAGLEQSHEEIDIEQPDIEPEALSPQSAEFVLEQHLEDFMDRNWHQIDFGIPLEIWNDEEGISGRQYPTGVGYVDFLCRNISNQSFVVVELKKGRTSDAVIGQCQRYMGWVKRNLETEGRPVYGLVIASDLDEKLRYALEVAPNISAMKHRLEFQLLAAEDDDGR